MAGTNRHQQRHQVRPAQKKGSIAGVTFGEARTAVAEVEERRQFEPDSVHGTGVIVISQSCAASVALDTNRSGLGIAFSYRTRAKEVRAAHDDARPSGG